MERIFEQLPKAKRWSSVLLVFSTISLASVIAAGFKNPSTLVDNIVYIVMQGFLVFFLFYYNRACSRGIEDESEEDLEIACRQQKNIFIMYGIQSALLLITFFILAFYLIILAMRYY